MAVCRGAEAPVAAATVIGYKHAKGMEIRRADRRPALCLPVWVTSDRVSFGHFSLYAERKSLNPFQTAWRPSAPIALVTAQKACCPAADTCPLPPKAFTDHRRCTASLVHPAGARADRTEDEDEEEEGEKKKQPPHSIGVSPANQVVRIKKQTFKENEMPPIDWPHRFGLSLHSPPIDTRRDKQPSATDIGDSRDDNHKSVTARIDLVSVKQHHMLSAVFNVGIQIKIATLAIRRLKEDLQGVASRYLLDLVAVDLARRHMTGLIFSFI
ncbi:hypothetical protein F2P81_015566 [Scophthalmus maximus]|uniref:Uncharacterized protein n=1 Tax=Scophthalmus maximus TaxID=52904 RepID=A0A6A4SDR2_SCOMX|nr:hypothetical protein F2P81_015566 [Scophthalmus maximus]